MAATVRSQQEMQRKCNKALGSGKVTDPVERMRLQLLSRGCNGIRAISRKFKIIDDDGSRSICSSEFKKAISELGLEMDKAQMDNCFTSFDKDGSGSIDFDEFLMQLRPPMSQARTKLIRQAFTKLDKTGDGFITIDDLRGVYSVNQHPKYKSGEWSDEKVLQQFLSTFEQDGDNQVTWDDFLNYYSGVSASVDQDAYFDLMMRQTWRL